MMVVEGWCCSQWLWLKKWCEGGSGGGTGAGAGSGGGGASSGHTDYLQIHLELSNNVTKFFYSFYTKFLRET